MGISYAQKAALVEYMVEPRHWYCHDPMPALDRWIRQIDDKVRFKDRETGTSADFKGSADGQLYDGRFFHRLPFDRNEWRGLTYDRLLNTVKLLFALEFGLEPHLSASALNFAQNGRFPSKTIAGTDLKERLMPKFNDVTEFDGFSVDVPVHHFSVYSEDNGFTVSTSIDNHKALLIQGEALRKIRTIAAAEDMFDPIYQTTSTGVMDVLKKSPSIKVCDQDWSFAVAPTLAPESLVGTVRALLRENLGLRPESCVILNLSETETLIGVNREAFESARSAEAARVKTMDLKPWL